MHKPRYKNLSQPTPPLPSYALAKKIFFAFLALTVAVTTLTTTFASPASSQFQTTPVTALSATGCTDGTFVDLTANPRVTGANNDLVEDCQALVAIQNHWAAVTDNNILSATHPLRTWGTGTTQKINTWANITITSKRVTSLRLFRPSIGFNPGIAGTIPTEIGNLTNLTQLYLHDNRLTGNIPTQIRQLTNLTSLILYGNRLTGNIPTQVGNLTNLTNLWLSSNRLTGTIPTEIGNLTNLTQLYLGNNQLTGNIPTEIGNLTDLTTLWLSSNRLTGNIPTEIGNLTDLTNLHLGVNQLTGAIPTQIGNLTNLTQLFLHDNRLTGAIPTQIGNLTNLTYLYLASNQLTGNIPTEIGNLTNLAGDTYSPGLDLSNNQLTGNIPTEIGNLTRLINLWLNDNRLTGSVPTQLGAITTLAHLGICRNQLTGALPSSLRTGVNLRDYPSADGYDPIACQNPISNIVFTAPPTNPTVSVSRSIIVDASQYASDNDFYTISCEDATNKHAKISSIARIGCLYTVTAGTQTGTASFTVPYTSAGGDTHNGTITITIGVASNIVFTAPTNLTMEAERNLTIDASTYATDGSYTITCGNPRLGDSKITSIRRDGCTYTLTAGSTTGTTTLIVPYTSAGGDTHNGTITITISSTTTPLGAITALSATGCTDGTFVDLTANPRVTGANNDLAEDCQALVAIQNHWAGVAANNNLPANHPLRTWGVGASQKIFNWSGIFSSGTSSFDRVGSIGLTDQDISGSIPIQLGNLTNLSNLNLSNNQLTGNIPTQLGNLTNLSNLWLNNNQLTGNIPTQLGSLTRLSRLAICNNYLTGAVPVGLQSGVLLLSYPTNAGYSSVQCQYANPAASTAITALSATGCTDGTFVDLTANPRVAGANNDLVEDCQALVAIQNHWAAVTANNSLPTEHPLRTWGTDTTNPGIENWANITINNNRISIFSLFNPAGSNPGISGSIPVQLGNLTSLTSLNLSGNRLTGNIPTQLGSLTALTNLSLYNNRLSGSIPSELGSLTALTNLSLGRNSLSGSIPSELGSLTSLTSLNFSRNQFTGAIPTQLGSLTNLTWLDLSNNQLTGNIPAELGNLTKLLRLDLGNDSESTGGNSISGEIPTTLGKLTSLMWLDLSHNQLSGEIPAQLANLAPATTPISTSGRGNLRSLLICGNYLSGSLPQANFLTQILVGYPTSQPSTSIGCQRNSSINLIPPTSLHPSRSLPVVSSGVSVPASRRVTINTRLFVTDGGYSISCADATNVSSQISSISREGCRYTVTAGSTAGFANFTVPYTSAGGATQSVIVTLTITPSSATSNIVFSSPVAFSMVAGASKTIDASSYATDGTSTISCADATSVSSKISITSRTGCSYVIAAQSNAKGIASFTVPYRSTGGDSENGIIVINISNITFTAPTGLAINTGVSSLSQGGLAIDALAYVTDDDYTISCADATLVDSKITVTRSSGCLYNITSGNTSGTATFTVPYTSSGGDTHNGVISITVNAPTTPAPDPISALSATGCTDGTFVDLTANPRVTGANNDLAEDCQALVAIQNHWAAVTDNNNLSATHPLRTWGTGTTQKINTWANITITNKRVTSLNLSRPFSATSPGIAGTIPTEIGNLTGLINLNLRSNRLTGNIPTQLSQLTKLTQLRLDSNSLTGAIPTEIGNLTNLTDLDLRLNRLTGAIPTEIGNLTGLTTLNLSGNRLTGNIPTQLGSLTALTNLSLGYNRLTGNIPTQIGNLTKLTGNTFISGLNLSGNRLTGNIPSQLGNLTKLTTLNLDNNRLTGNIPTELAALATPTGSLTWLFICRNYFTGAVPTALRTAIPSWQTTTYDPVGCQWEESPSGTAITTLPASGCTDGTFVDLVTNPRVEGSNNDLAEDCQALVAIQNHWAAVTENNILSATHPLRTWGTGTTQKINTWSNITITNKRVTSLNLSRPFGGISPGIAGTIPTQLGNLTELTNLNLGTNLLTGAIPTEIGNLTNLTQLGLSDNRLTGAIPTEIGNLINLTNLYLHDNQLTGTIPTEIGNLTGLTTLNLSNNRLTGNIPTEIGNLTGLTTLNLSSNRLTGNIPTEIGNLTNLTNLDLGFNRLTGNIPTQIGNLTNLTNLDLGLNRLTGNIPTQIGNLTNLTELDLSYNRLTGNIPTQLSQLTKLTQLGLSDNRLTGTIPTELATLATPTGSLTQLTICRNYFTGAVPTALHTAIPSWETTTYDPIGCQIASSLRFNAPSDLSVPAGRQIIVNALNYASDGGYTVTCSNPTSVSNGISVTRNGCQFNIKAGTIQGSATFAVLFSSAGGTTANGTIRVTVGPPSDTSEIVFSAPSGLTITGSQNLRIDASTYASDGNHIIMCADATRIHSRLSSVTRDGCVFTITPGDNPGIASFVVPYTSSGGDTHNGAISIGLRPNSDITFTDPGTLAVDINRSITFDASQYASDGSYTISCGVAREESDQIASVVRIGNTCRYTVTASSTSGAATFIVPYRSSGGDTLDATFSVIVYRPPSHIFFRGSFDLELGTNQTLVIDALDYASDGGYSVSCGDATGVSTSIITIQRANPSGEPCEFTVTPSGTQGEASFTVPYTSSGGTSRNGVFTIEVGPASTIAYSAPSGLMLGTNRTRIIDAASYVTDGGYVITCGTATGVDSKISVTQANPSIASCEFTITATGAQGAASFTVPYTSSGGATQDGTINIAIGAASTIVYTAPTELTMTASSTLTIDAAAAVTDGSYTITCGQATNRDTKITRATNTGCSYQISVGADTGTATFTVPYTSAGGHTLDGQISITITELPRNTAPILDRQDTICSMVGMEPVRSSTADEITQGDNQAAFCQQNGELHCFRGANRAFIDTLLINIRGWDNSIKDCYQAIS